MISSQMFFKIDFRMRSRPIYSNVRNYWNRTEHFE